MRVPGGLLCDVTAPVQLTEHFAVAFRSHAQPWFLGSESVADILGRKRETSTLLLFRGESDWQSRFVEAPSVTDSCVIVFCCDWNRAMELVMAVRF